MARSQDIVNTITTTDAPSTLRKKFAYTVDSLVEYAGSAPRGSSTSDLVWTITKYTYSNQQVTDIQTAFSSWDNYLTADYS